MNPVLNAPLGPDGLPLPVDPQRVQQFFEDFYEDLFLELTQYGQIESLCVCDNIADHMVGNVYVKFRDEESAAKAVKGVQGRYYAGKQISAEFSPVMDFKESTCRQYEEGTCNRGGYCNFMHVRPAGPEVRVQCFGRYGALTSADTRSRVLTLSLALRATRYALRSFARYGDGSDGSTQFHGRRGYGRRDNYRDRRDNYRDRRDNYRDRDYGRDRDRGRDRDYDREYRRRDRDERDYDRDDRHFDGYNDRRGRGEDRRGREEDRRDRGEDRRDRGEDRRGGDRSPRRDASAERRARIAQWNQEAQGQ